MSVHRLDRAEARRIAVRAQLLDTHRPTDLLALVHHLTFLQLDPTAAIAPSADLVAWTRLGDAYRPADLTGALEQDRTLYEVRAIIRPTADLGLHVAQMAAWPFVEEQKRANRRYPARVPPVGWRRTTTSAGTSSSCCKSRGRCSHATYRTRASCRGNRQVGRATAT